MKYNLTEKQLREARKINSSKAGKACLKRHGKDFYSRIASEAWAKRRVNARWEKPKWSKMKIAS